MTKRNQFVAVLGHEMRNSLTAIRGALDIWAVQNPSTMDDLRQLLERQLKLLTRLSEDLLGGARNGDGGLTMRQSNIVLQTVLVGSIEQVEPSVNARGQTLHVDDLDKSAVICGDEDRLTQAFSNILQNASKFTQCRGRIFVTLRCEGKQAVVRIRDTGQGIAQNHLASVFESGNVSDGAGSSEPRGFGIGLKLVKAVIESHEGTVVADSPGEGCGSEFTIRLPLLGGDTHASKSQAAHPCHVGGLSPTAENDCQPLHILIADDLRPIRELLSRQLAKIGHKVDIARNGEEALELAMRTSPQIVFLDLGMPGMSGFELGRRLRERFTTEKMVLVAISGDNTEEHRLRARDAGMDAYLAKPVGISDLCEILKAVNANRCFSGSHC